MKRPARARKSKGMLNQNDPSSQSSQNNPSPYYNQYNSNNLNNSNSQSDQKRPTSYRGCFVIVLAFVGIFVVLGLLSILHAQSQPPAILYQGDPPFNMFAVLVGMWAVVAFFLIVLNVRRRSRPLSKPVKRWFAVLVVVASCISLMVLFWSIFINPNIGMTRTGFMRTDTVKVNNGDTIHFRNPSNGLTQILCVGVDQHCQAKDGDPSQLDRGLVIEPGQTVSIVFSTDGDYQITSKTTPHMNVTINVSTADNSG